MFSIATKQHKKSELLSNKIVQKTLDNKTVDNKTETKHYPCVEREWKIKGNLPGSSSSSAQSIWPETYVGYSANCNTIQMVRTVADNRTIVNVNLKSIFNGWNSGSDP